MGEMLQALVLGGGFAFAAVVQPGPLQAFLLSRAATEGWRRTLPAAFSPLLSDGPIALVVLLVLGRVPASAQHVLRAAGGVLLLYLAWAAYREMHAGSGGQEPSGASAPRTLLQAAAVNLLNPNPYLGWALVLGPAAVTAWRQSPPRAAALILAFYGVMVVGLASFIVVAGAARRLPRRALVFISAGVLAALGVYQLVVGVHAMSVAISVLVVVVASAPIVWLSWRSLLRPASHGFFRFFAAEAILIMVVLNAPVWFVRPLAARQLASWLLLVASAVCGIAGFVLLHRLGGPRLAAKGSPQFTFENTSHLVTTGAYRFIRHPLYASLLFLAWGVLLKAVSTATVVLAALATVSLLAAARAEEAENLARFGTVYRDYMACTRRFIPFVF
jgi:protein-S-isoprenylcysteine O-methyltransferase Ste14/threonine/homoserine/homoserine lactone efflux protein